MRTRTKRLWLALAAMFLAIVVGALIWTFATRRPPIILTLPNGDQYRFVGITYGTNDVPHPFLAKLVNLLPKKMADRIDTKLDLPSPGLSQGAQLAFPPIEGPMYRLWFERVATAPLAATNSYSSYSTVLADESGSPGGQRGYVFNGQWMVIPVTALPRRSPEINCHFDAAGASGTPVAKVSIPNPYYGHFPQWVPEPTPAVKTNGDLQVHLRDLSQDNQWTMCALSVVSTAGVKWAYDSMELSDATSNRIVDRNIASHDVNTTQSGWGEQQEMAMGLTPLWPDEAAWRLKVNCIKIAGLASNELVKLVNVQIPATGITNTLTVTNGGKVMKVAFFQGSDIQGAIVLGWGPSRPLLYLKFVWRDLPEGTVADLVDAETDAGPLKATGWPVTASSISLDLESMAANAHTMDLTFAIQKPRSVEFLVKPPKPN